MGLIKTLLRFIITIVVIIALLIAYFAIFNPDKLDEFLSDRRTEYVMRSVEDIMGQTEGMTDEEISAKIDEIASRVKIDINDENKEKIISVLRKCENVDAQGMEDAVRSIEKTVRTITAAQETAAEIKDKIGAAFFTVFDFVSKAVSGLSNLVKR